MPWSQPVPFVPGVNTVKTPVLNGSGWSLSNCIRFRDGLPEKQGGWARISSQTMVGTARGMHVWAALNTLPYIIAGSEQRLMVLSLAGLTDVTPLLKTTNNAVNFSTIINTPTVTIVDAGMPATLAIGDWVNVLVPVSIGGIVIQGLVQVTALPTATSFSFTWTSNATATVNNAGAVPTYTTTNTSADVVVTLNDNGYAVNDTYENQVSTTVATIVFGAFSEYTVGIIIDANSFHITGGSVANATTTASENAGHARLEYLIPTGYATSTLLAGFGEGMFGAGLYSSGGSGIVYSIIRQWFLDNWGEDAIGNYPASPLYVWIPPVAGGNRALAIDTTNYPSATSPPEKVNFSFVSMPSQIMIALGVNPSGGGTQDPNLVRWSNVSDFTDWVASATNQAGSYRVPTGSRIVGGLRAPMFAVIWTDVDMYVFNYIGFPLVFSFNLVSGGVGLLAGHCACMVQSTVFFAGPNGIYRFDGSNVVIVPCPVWDTMWANINRIQVDKCHMGANSYFQELTLWFVSNDASNVNMEIDSYIRYNWRDNVWDIGIAGTLFTRTSWSDINVFGPPIGIDLNDLFQQHEIAYDADGAQMMEYIESGFFQIDQGWLFTLLDQLVADFKWRGTNQSLQIWIYGINYPSDIDTGLMQTWGPFTETPTTPQFDEIGASARMIKVRIGFSNVGSWWRLGNTRYLAAPNGQI